MRKKKWLITGFIMVFIALTFVVFALQHPEMSFNLPNVITYILYGVYIVAMVFPFLMFCITADDDKDTKGKENQENE